MQHKNVCIRENKVDISKSVFFGDKKVRIQFQHLLQVEDVGYAAWVRQLLNPETSKEVDL